MAAVAALSEFSVKEDSVVVAPAEGGKHASKVGAVDGDEKRRREAVTGGGGKEVGRSPRVKRGPKSLILYSKS
jgi:hypothetical protein